MENEISIIDRLKHKIQSENITQREVARRLGVTAETVNRWIRGTHKPSKLASRLIVSVLNV